MCTLLNIQCFPQTPARMESQLCSMCQREWAPIASYSEETDGILEELAESFEVARNSFRGNKFCADCHKLLTLTHQISIKIRKRKQAEEQGKPVRRPSVGQSEGRLSLAKRMRSAQQAARHRDPERGGCTETKENLCVDRKDETVSESKSDEGNYPPENDHCIRFYRERSRSL